MNIVSGLRSAWYNWRYFKWGLVNPSFGARLVVERPRSVWLGDNFSCGRDCFLSAAESGYLSIGMRCSLNNNVHINAAHGGKIVIGKNVLIGPNVVIRGANHRTSDRTKPIREQGHKAHAITIGDNVWIGANAVICAGALIESDTVVPAGKVVTRFRHQEELQYAGSD